MLLGRPPTTINTNHTNIIVIAMTSSQPHALPVNKERLAALAEDTRTLMKRNALNICDIGVNLLEARKLLAHGEFLSWIKEELDISKSSAYRFMDVAKAFKDKLPKMGTLEIAPSALYLLASQDTPDGAIKEALELADAGQPISQESAKNIINKHHERKAKETANASARTPRRKAQVKKSDEQQQVINKARDEINQLEAQIEDAEDEIKQLKADRDSLKAENSKLHDEIARLKEELAVLTAKEPEQKSEHLEPELPGDRPVGKQESAQDLSPGDLVQINVAHPNGDRIRSRVISCHRQGCRTTSRRLQRYHRSLVTLSRASLVRRCRCIGASRASLPA